ncbi:uncharacterized protein LOC128724474 [Anopheles nili]|uniref:uncharacterized protein LOC128724474 n=1 Tax=Anopheles nili TaxID=185578 RepID=UPI00237C1D6D|nr:uncharacterized protein LOC128724474 [Anopheles nili]
MSECLEDSPLSDNRMDISENTASHGSSPPVHVGSPDFSPMLEIDGVAMEPSPPMDRHDSDSELGNGVESHCHSNSAAKGATTESIEIHKLAITNVPSPVSTAAVSSRLTSSSTVLTPVSSHPLMMSPTGSESDLSEYIVSVQQNRKSAMRNYYHYPDVVPASEQPLRLASPYTNRRSSDNQDKGSIDNVDNSRTVTMTSNRRGKVSPAKRLHATVTNPKAGKHHSSTKVSTVVSTSTLDVINNAIHMSNDSSPINCTSQTHLEGGEEMGSDFFSTDSEDEQHEDVSLFQASVTPTFQSVALLPSPPQSIVPTSTGLHPQKQQSKSISPRLHQRRKVPLPSDLLVDDVSSMEDSLSNQSVDELQQNLVSLSPSSSILDDNGFNVDIDEDFLDLPGTPKATGSVDSSQDVALVHSAVLPQYSAREEARDIRNWQKITLPDGKTREIDMKVIEPYKCVLSHGGYLQAGGHNAIVVFSACHLPDRSRADYHYVMNNLFLYVVKTLEQLVTEDYVLVYLHGGSSRGNVPPFPWLKKCYQLLDRRLRKSLRNLYMVHPTFWLKSVVWMARPFISSKFWRKLIYVTSLEELYKLVPVEKAAIPDKVKNYNAR